MKQNDLERKNAAFGLRKPEEPNEETIDLLELCLDLLAHWKLIAAAALVGAALAAAYTFFLVTPMYKATATLYVVSRNDSVINLSDLQLGSALTSDYIKVFNTWEIHEKVIDALDLNYSYGQIARMLSVTNSSGTRMLDITVTNADPQLAADIANEYAEVGSAYIAEKMKTDEPTVLSTARVPANPVSPNRTRNTMLGFLLGFALACGVVVVQALLDDTYKTAEDIRKYTGMVVLATVPRAGGNHVGEGGAFRRRAGKKAGRNA